MITEINDGIEQRFILTISDWKKVQKNNFFEFKLNKCIQVKVFN